MSKLVDIGSIYLKDRRKYYASKELYPNAEAFVADLIKVCRLNYSLNSILPHVITGYMIHLVSAIGWRDGKDDDWWAYDFEGDVWLVDLSDVEPR